MSSSSSSTSTPGLPTGATTTAAATQAVNPPPKYALQPPARRPISLKLLGKEGVLSAGVLLYLIRHTLGFFESRPTATTPLTLSQPAGTILDPMLAVCEHLADDAQARLTKLETKASGLLSLIALVIPLTASAAVFIRQHPLPQFLASMTLALDLLAVAFFLLGLIAALRALAVRGQEALFLDAVINPATDTVRAPSADFFGRGLLYVAAACQAVCDHIADFVRGAQVFLAIGVAFAAFSAGAVLFEVHEDQQTINGTVTIARDSLNQIRGDLKTALIVSSAQQNRFEVEIQSLRQQESELLNRSELEHEELATLRRRLASHRHKQRKAASSGNHAQ